MGDVIVGTALAIAYVMGFAWVGVFVSRSLLPRESPVLRCLATAIAALLTATLVFHGLLAVSRFDRLSALVVVGLLVAGCIALDRSLGDPGERKPRSLSSYLSLLASTVARTPGRSRWIALASTLGFLLFTLVTITRSITLPTVGWDSITYHYVKAGMWVQRGGPIELDAPGGWSMYRAIFGGGEVFTAWSMLAFGNDTLAGAVDAFFWVGIALVLFALGRELGLRVRERAAVAVYALFIPAIWDAVGWGYVDLTSTALQLTGLLLAMRYFRTRAAPLIGFAMAALGLAAGTKLTAGPVLASAGFVFLYGLVTVQRGQRLAIFNWLAGGSLVALLCIVPWLVQNLIETGYPLRFPMEFFGIALGADNAAFDWSQDRDLPAYEFAAEFAALSALFQWPWVNLSHLGIASLLPLVLAPAGFARVFRTNRELRAPLVLALLICGATLVAFYDRAFSFSRLEFFWVNGRFLQIIVCLALPLAFRALAPSGSVRDGLGLIIAIAAAVQCLAFASYRFLQPTPQVVIGGLVAGALAVVAAIAIRARIPSPGVRVVALGLLVLVCAMGLDHLRDPERRYMLLVGRNTSDDVFRYWWQAGHLSEIEGDALRIAVTAGPRQDADNWLMYYFMGSDLQNSLHYLPISTDGEIIPFGPDERRRREGDVDAWLSRVTSQEISHVLSFFPTSIELEWMEARPDRFQRLAGYKREWGFYRVVARP